MLQPKKLKFVKWNKLTDPAKHGFDPLRIQFIDISAKSVYKVLTQVEWIKFCKNLEKLCVDFNQIRDICEFPELPNLICLNFCCNYIERIAGLQNLTALTDLNLSCNKIEKVCGLENLTNLTFLDLRGNKIKNIENLARLTNLITLNLDNNEIHEIGDGLSKLLQLEKLYLRRNKITKIEGLSSLVQLKELDLTLNQIEKIEGLESLQRLTKLCLGSNRISVVEGVSQLVNLDFLDLSDNSITFLPNILVYSPRLTYLKTRGNPIETYHPVIENFLAQRREVSAELFVYSDRESVHSVSIQSHIRKNITKLLETDRLSPFRDISAVIESVLSDTELPEETKSVLIEYSADVVNEITALPGVHFGDVLIPVWNRITNLTEVSVATEIKRVLAVEMADAECVCFTGRVSRLVNCLTGFFPDISVEISKSDQISNIIFLAKRKLFETLESGYSREAHVNLVKIEMTERGYTSEEIEVWTAAIE